MIRARVRFTNVRAGWETPLHRARVMLVAEGGQPGEHGSRSKETAGSLMAASGLATCLLYYLGQMAALWVAFLICEGSRMGNAILRIHCHLGRKVLFSPRAGGRGFLRACVNLRPKVTAQRTKRDKSELKRHFDQ